MTLEQIFEESNTKEDIFDGFDDIELKDFEPEKEEKLNKTLDIETLDLNEYLPKEDVSSILKSQELTSEKKDDDISIIKEYFINCSVLAFITAFAGTIWLINIIKNIY